MPGGTVAVVTTVAAVARDGLVVAAADTLVNIWDRPVPGGASKLVNLLGGRAVLGVAGDVGLVAAARYDLDPPEFGADLDEWAHRVAAALTDLAVTRGLLREGRVDGEFILGASGRLWQLFHSQAVAVPDGVVAAGSGEAVAIGAMDALLSCGVEPQTVPRTAVRIACARDRHTAGPIHVEVVGASPTP